MKINESGEKIIENGDKVVINYKGTFEDGVEFDSSYSRGEPMNCMVGNGSLIEGFDSALMGMKQGETKSVTIPPEKAYGEYRDGGVMDVPASSFGESFVPEPGAAVYGRNDAGQEILATIISFDQENVKLDFNHPMAGKSLNFEISVESVEAS